MNLQRVNEKETIKSQVTILVTYNVFDILVGKVKVGEGLEVLCERESLFLFEVLSGLSNQIYSQKYHPRSSQTASEDLFQVQSGIQPS